MKIKVIIWNGIIETVLADQEAQMVDVEIIDFDDNYEEAEKIEDYAEVLKSSPELTEIEYTVTNFEEEEEQEAGAKCSLGGDIANCKKCAFTGTDFCPNNKEREVEE